MGLYLHRVRRNCPPLAGLHPPRAVLDFGAQINPLLVDETWVSTPCSVDREELGFIPRVALALHTSPSQSAIGG